VHSGSVRSWLGPTARAVGDCAAPRRGYGAQPDQQPPCDAASESGTVIRETTTPGEAAMSTTQDSSSDSGVMACGKNVDLKLEVVVIEVSDVDRPKDFYRGPGRTFDADFSLTTAFELCS
jgi:hypothetical protein